MSDESKNSNPQVGHPLAVDPLAQSASPTEPAFIAKSKGAPVYHGFPILSDVVVDGFTLGKISDFDAEPCSQGLDTANGKVLTQCRPRHRHQDYLAFLREIEKNVPKNLEVHIIIDNYATHMHLRVRRWFAARPRFQVHFTPTYASWLIQVEIWFNRITQRAIRRGTFGSVKELVAKIDHYVKNSNRHAQPFVWTATADSIFAKVERLCELFTGHNTRSHFTCFATYRDSAPKSAKNLLNCAGVTAEHPFL